MKELEWLDEYTGQTVDELLALEGKYRIDSLVLAFEEAIERKGDRDPGAVTDEEVVVLAVEALEREVNNGGYDQFFRNPSQAFALVIVDSLNAIGCKQTAAITQKAIDALRLSTLSVEAIDACLAVEDSKRDDELAECDDLYFERPESIEDNLFAFIKANRSRITL